jgi:ATP-dependent Clp protease ATP-binding subunit ClpB
VDEIVVFRPLTREHVGRIVEIQLARLRKLLEERRITIELSEAAREAIADAGYDPVYGARPLKRAIQRLLENPLALELLEGRFSEGDVVRVDAGGDGLVFERLGAAAPTPA